MAMNGTAKRFGLALAGGILVGAAGASIGHQGPSKDQTGSPARPRAEETLEWWNHIGNKLIAMAKDFPEDQYDFKAQKDERTFAQNLLHVAAVDYDLISKVSGSTVGPDFGKDKHNPSREIYKTKADVVKLLESAVADGAAVIKQQGDAGLEQTMPFGWETGRHVVHVSYIWMAGIEHSSEHFGQLVVYYRANNLVPPESRR
jgi:uncharacterized damage-inducible protein DinB